jgi:hypothetical protein
MKPGHFTASHALIKVIIVIAYLVKHSLVDLSKGAIELSDAAL